MAVVLVLIAMFSVQLGASLAKGLFPIVGPAAATTLRISIAAILLVIIWRPWRQRLTKQAYRAVILYGICLGTMNLTFYVALTRIPLGICVALEFLGPLTVSLVASRKKIDFLWAFLAALGVFLILPLKAGPDGLDPLGIAFALMAGVCWAFYILLGKKVGEFSEVSTGISLGMVVAALVTLPFGLDSGTLSDLSPKILGIGTCVAVLSSAIPYSFEMAALKKIPTKTFGILMSLEPALAALCGYIFLSESLSILQCIAILSVMIASAGSAFDKKKSQP